jgi:hypothetical protein
MLRTSIVYLMTEVGPVEFFVLTKQNNGERPIFLPVK